MDNRLQWSQDEIAQGIADAESGDIDGGVSRLQSVLDELDEVSDDAQRRDLYGRLATYFNLLGRPDLALLAAQEAIELDRRLNDRNMLGQDILLAGTCLGRLGNTKGALKAYREAHTIFVEDENWGNAASASTNIAVIVGQENLSEAIDMLEESLTYLARAPFPATEITTRLALLQALVVDDRGPERVFEVADGLFNEFYDDLRPDQVVNSVGPLDEAISRYFPNRTSSDRAAWRQKRYPMLDA